MLTFKTEDTKLTIWINGNTKTPDALTQEELAQLQKNGDPRVEEVPEAPAQGKSAKA